MAVPPFRLDELGSLEFQRLCVELLGLELGGFEARPWGVSLLVDEGAGGLPGPTLVLVAWARRGAVRLDEVVDDALAAWTHPIRSVLLATNVDGYTPPAEYELEWSVVGPQELWDRFASDPRARFHAPSALGVADLDALIPREVAERSTADIDATAELARVFVPTSAYAQTLDVLQRHRFAVLTGPPEMGKTAIARMIGLAALTNGWELHECVRPDELWARFDPSRPQVFVADDAFGSTEYRADAAERWAVDLDRVLRAMDERHWLLWTSRPAPFKAGLRRIHREHGVERFPQPAEVGVDASELELTEKALILFRHAKHASLPEKSIWLVQRHGWDIVSHEHFTPERIRRFAIGRLRAFTGDVAAHVDREIREPTDAMTSSYRALEPDHRAILVALLDVPPGPVPERELAAAVRRHSTGGLAHPVNEIVDRLADHFLRVVDPASVVWVHPSWRDLVIEEVATNAEVRRAFLEECGIHGVTLALSTAGGAAGERSLPLLVDDGDWDCVADRIAALAPDLDPPDVTMLLGALEAAREAAEGEGTWLAEGALGALARCWNRRCSAVPVGLLAGWFELAAKLPDPPLAPSAAATWFEVVPTDVVDVADDALAFDEWTALVDVLVDHDPVQLPAYGFPDEQLPAMEAFLAGAETADPAMPHVDAVVRSLRRLAEWLPEPQRAYDAWFRLDPPRYDVEVVYEPRELSPELERILEAPLPSVSDGRDQVARVLRDL